ncbi:MAG: hypothetical protein CVU00_11930 [Bacteroidetes bacterium HGW-Bacteroidetes-17]|jgi:hypothetical protein|nr:MAG: hypothetical protein CVU00_11930 [Bacteroidetes bacterium HGW-Bacteroidetes-17]
MLLREPFTQSVLARIVTTYLSQELNADIKINEVTVTAFFNLLIKGVEVNDLHQKNIFSAEQVEVNIDKFNYKKRKLNVKQLKLKEAIIDLKIYKNEDDMNFQFLIDHFTSNNSADSLQQKKWDLSISAIQLSKSKFSMINENKALTEVGMDYDRIVVDDIDLDLANLRFIGDTVLFEINKLNAIEKSGFLIKQFSGEFALSEKMLEAKKIKIETNQSELDFDFKFSYNDFSAYEEFIDKVMIDARLRNSTINLADLGFFAPELFEMNDEIFINTSFKGTVEDFTADQLRFKFGSSTEFEGKISMKGLPNIENTYTDLIINKFYTSAKDLANFAIPIDGKFLALPAEIYEFGECSIVGYLNGMFKNFTSDLDLNTEIGSLSANINMNTQDSLGMTFYNGHFQSLSFDLGKMLKIPEYLGTMNLDLDFNGSGLTNEDIKLKLDGVISSVELMQNNYNQIIINGELADKKFDGHLDVTDENIDFQFNGSVDFNKDIPEFNFNTDIQHANLYKINLLKYDSTATLSTQLNLNYAGINLDDLEGMIQVSNTVYEQNNKIYMLDNLTLNSNYDGLRNKIIELRSDYIDADIKGKFKFAELFASVESMIGQYIPRFFYDSINIEPTLPSQNLDFEINFKNSDALTDLLYPSLKIAPNSKIAGHYYTDLNSVYVQANSSEIELMGIKFYDWYLKTDNDAKAFLILTGSKDVVFKTATENDSTSFGLENFNLLASVQNDSINYRIAWNDTETRDDNKGYLSGYFKFNNRTEFEMKLKKADFIINNKAWNIDLNSHLAFDKSLFSIDSLNIFSDKQSLFLTGAVSEQADDTLKVIFRNWDLSSFDLLINDPNLNVDGIIDGEIQLMDLYDSPKVTARLGIAQLALNEQQLGRGVIRSTWNNANNSLEASFDIINIGNAGEGKVFGLAGTYFPNRDEHNLDFGIDLSNLDLQILSPYVSDFMSELEGLASGRLLLDGSLSKPRIIGNVNLMRTAVKIDYTNVKYSLSNEIKFRENEIQFDHVVLYDTLGNQAICQGKITHEYFDNFKLDINIKPQKVLGLNTNKSQNSMFYGTAFASGDVNIRGPLDEIVIDIAVRSERGTQIKIPISYDSEMTETNYIVFVNSADTVSKPIDYKVDLSGLSLNLNLSVTQDADIELFLPYKMGNIRADGSGDINITVNSRGDFEIIGDYFIHQGTFLFTLQNLVSRRFSILEGGKISWTGNPYEAELDIKTLYKTKASLAGFDIENDRRYNIDCFLDLSQQLSDPTIHFSIAIPNIDKEDEQKVFAQLDTENEAQMNQQMISLLVLGSFSSSANMTPSAGEIGASSINVLSNQLSNWLSQISKDFDIGINYRPSGAYTEQEVEVALSTQLFNNRVLIDGNFGVLGNQQSSNTSGIVGDVNVEVKITDDGRFRIKVFNRSNINSAYNTNTLDDRSPYTQGVGIFYRREFDNFGDLFSNGKPKSKKVKDAVL